MKIRSNLAFLLGASITTSFVWLTNVASAWQPSPKPVVNVNSINNRRTFLKTPLVGVAIAGLSITSPANALVKGNAPPPKMKPAGEKPKCSNIEECQALAEQQRLADEQAAAEAAAQESPPQSTAGGTRYRDLQFGEGTQVVKDGDEVTVYYKVLKLGKRSFDGISGEGTVIFSRGYGLEDDEVRAGDKSFVTTVGAYSNIAAFNDAITGMKVGGLRRFSILPQYGWRKPGRECDGGPGGQGAGGELKTDYIVVPTATMVAQEACFDSTKQPFPATYAQQRRMAQRFDQSLIMEVQLVSINSSGSL